MLWMKSSTENCILLLDLLGSNLVDLSVMDWRHKALIVLSAFSALTLLVEWQEGHPACKKTEWWGAGMVICLEWGADLHMGVCVCVCVSVCLLCTFTEIFMKSQICLKVVKDTWRNMMWLFFVNVQECWICWSVHWLTCCAVATSGAAIAACCPTASSSQKLT